MKRAFGYGVAWLLYGVGDAVSRPMEWWGASAYVLYPCYNWLMGASVDVQDWCGAGPWRGPDEN